MLVSLLSYLTAIIVFRLCDFFASILLFPFVGVLRSRHSLLPFAHFALDFASGFVAVVLVQWLAAATPLYASYAMLIIAALPIALNMQRRINAAKQGTSSLRATLASQGLGREYHQSHQSLDVRTERAAFFGYISGYVLAIVTIFRAPTFF